METVYDPLVYSSIPSLHEASASVFANPGLGDCLSDFKQLSARYAQNDRFGLSLVHRHAKVPRGHRMMDFKQTLQPFPLSDDACSLHGFPIRPKSYALRQGLWKPYEYELGALENDRNEEEYFQAVRELIERYQLEHAGLRRYRPEDPEELEITESGGISIKIPTTPDQSELLGEHILTFWAYPSGEPKLYRCACMNSASEETPNHHHIDLP